MRRSTQGMTIIELCIVIAILGILAAVSFPKLFGVSSDAQVAATNSVASALSAASAQNYAARTEKTTNGSPVTNCTSTATLLQGGVLPTGYTITAAAVAVNVTVTCTLSGPSGTTASFVTTGVL